MKKPEASGQASEKERETMEDKSTDKARKDAKTSAGEGEGKGCQKAPYLSNAEFGKKTSSATRLTDFSTETQG
jgi:hypothetical protein